MAPYSSTLAWKTPWTRSLVGCSPWGRKESDSTEQLRFHFHALEKEMATYSSVLVWRIPGTGEPGGLLSMGLHRVGHNWSDLAVAAADLCNKTFIWKCLSWKLQQRLQLLMSVNFYFVRKSDTFLPAQWSCKPSKILRQLHNFSYLFLWWLLCLCIIKYFENISYHLPQFYIFLYLSHASAFTFSHPFL